jgi:hypothetical protein
MHGLILYNHDGSKPNKILGFKNKQDMHRYIEVWKPYRWEYFEVIEIDDPTAPTE